MLVAQICAQNGSAGHANFEVAIMSLADLPVLGVLKQKMKWHQARQNVLAQNVANSDTPGFRPRDLKPFDFEAALRQIAPVKTSAAVTNSRHIRSASIAAGSAEFEARMRADWETTPSGNAVSLEDQMMKVTANQMEFQAASTLYSRSLGLLRIALGGQR